MHDKYDPDLHGYFRSPPAQHGLAIIITLAVATGTIGAIAWLMTLVPGGW